MTKTIVICGAGASKACGAPLTAEILPEALCRYQELEREGYLALLGKFLQEEFHLSSNPALRSQNDYPPLPLLLSLVDTALDRKQPFGSFRDPDEVLNLRSAIEYAIFAVIEHALRSNPARNYYALLLQKVFGSEEPHVISFNYDLLADNTLAQMSESLSRAGFPDYGCDIGTEVYLRHPSYGTLLKLHGSLGWTFCPGCNRLDIGIAENDRRFAKVLDLLYQEVNLNEKYACRGSPCTTCATYVRPIMITPSFRKDYRNPHITRVWYKAEEALRVAKRVIFVGYSLPDDDVEVIYLLKKSLRHLQSAQIEVVSRSPSDSDVAKRYRVLFGPGVLWHDSGIERWVDG
jgi:hypothetical protein